MSGSVVHSCKNCPPHEYQDKTYGVGNRLFNISGKKEGTPSMRCTVCGNKVNRTK